MSTRQVAFRLKSDGKAELKRDFAEVGQSGAAAYERVEQAANEAGQASDRQMAKYRQMAEAARQAGRAAEEQRKFNAVLGVDREVKSAQDSASAFVGARGRGMSTMQRQTAIYTVSDIVASAGSGMSPGMIALQQGPQVLQAIAIQGGVAVSTMLKLATAIGAPVAVLGLLSGAWLKNREDTRQLEISVSGVGAATGATADSLYALAEANKVAGDVSGAAAREMAASYANTGRIGEEVIGNLIALTRSYATTTSQDAKAATQELGQAFADPAKGVDVLNAKLGFLDDGTYRYIQTLLEQNRVTDAQLVLSDALARKLQTAAENTTVLGRAWDGVKNSAVSAFDAIGRAIDRAMSGGTALQRVTDLTNERVIQAQVPFGMGMARVREIDAELSQIRAKQAAQDQAAASARANQVAADARAVQDRINPRTGRLRELRRDEARLQGAIDQGVLSDPDQAAKDLGALRKEIAAVEAGYSSASAQASALGQAGRRAATDARKDAREAEREAKEALRNAERLQDLKLRDQLVVARLQDNKVLVEQLETETRLRSLINDYENAGVDAAKARLMAQIQIGAETKAEFETRRKMLIATPSDFVSTEAAMAKFHAMRIAVNDNEAAATAMRGAYESAFDLVADRLAAGGQAWGSWADTARAAIQDIIGEMIRLAAINPLKNALFGTENPTLGDGGIFSALSGGKSGVVDALKSGASKVFDVVKSFKFPGFAKGVDSAPGGWAWTGEEGPELVRLPRGSQVFDAKRSAGMAAGAAPNISITLDARGAGPREVDELRAQVAELEKRLPGLIVETVGDAQGRRWLRGG